jgi:pseudouridine-5'-phosphate glycosidase
MPSDPPPFALAAEVADALSNGRPVVALESTIISHGMPFPENLATARAVEDVVRAQGAIPATIAVIDGTLRVGLGDEIERFARSSGVAKASSRDLAAVMIRGQSAGTTVSATMRVAALAGIPIFATGGVGGVHRGAERSFDISADLVELGRTGTAVVCAGVKSILDIPKTLEFLETQRVPVYGYRTNEFPAFYSRASGEAVEHRFDSAAEIARALALHARLGSGAGVLIANPLPEEDAMDGATIEATVARAVADADAQGVAGKALTPFLLARIAELSAGASLVSNIALIRNNAALAAGIAVALAALRKAQ